MASRLATSPAAIGIVFSTNMCLTEEVIMTGRSMRMERAALSRALRGEGRVVLTVGDLAVRSRGAATEAAGIKMLPDPLVEEAAAMSEE